MWVEDNGTHQHIPVGPQIRLDHPNILLNICWDIEFVIIRSSWYMVGWGEDTIGVYNTVSPTHVGSFKHLIQHHETLVETFSFM